jgi:hypothetical protein
VLTDPLDGLQHLPKMFEAGDLRLGTIGTVTNGAACAQTLYVIRDSCDPGVMQRAVTMVFVEPMSRFCGPERRAR